MREASRNLWRRKAVLRFYLSESVWLFETLRKFLKGLTLWVISALFCFGCALAITLIDRRHLSPGLAELGIVLSVALGFIFIALAILFLAAFGTWFSFWWLGTMVLRWRYAGLLRSRSWPAVLITPRLVRFPARVWGRLPEYEQIRVTGWCDEWWGGEFHPLNLCATLALIEELDLDWRSAYDGRKTARERIEEVIAW